MKIGVIDYFLSEFHANNFPGWIEICAKNLGIDAKIAYAYAELDKSPYDNVTTKEWCEKYGATNCSTIDELCRLSDAIIILSPDNPEKHLPYAKAAFKYSKPVYVDKTFATSLEEAKQIYQIASDYNTPFFTSSALGFASELEGLNNINSVITLGGGGSLFTYIIHQLEMIVKVMGTDSKRAISISSGKNATVGIDYGNDRTATINFGTGFSYGISVDCGEDYSQFRPINSDFFINQTIAILNFFVDKKEPLSKEHTLEVMALRDACLLSQNKKGKYVEVKK